MKKIYLLLLIPVYGLIGNIALAQQAGGLDATFGVDGVAHFTPNQPMIQIKVQSDQKVVAMDGDSLYRLSDDGFPDDTFGSNGTTDLPCEVRDMVVMPDDENIVVMGDYWSCGYDPIYVYDTNGQYIKNLLSGTWTPAFQDIIAVSDTEIRISDCDYGDIRRYSLSAYDAYIGNINHGIPAIVEGCVGIEYENGHMITSHSTPWPEDDLLLLYISKNGDNTFGDNGSYVETFPAVDSIGNLLSLTRRGNLLQSDNKVVYAYTYDNTYYIDRLNADGTPDQIFNQVAFPGYTIANQSFVINSNDEIIVTGYNTSNEPFLKIISQDGSQIADFEGYIFAPDRDLAISSIAIQADDAILLSGMAKDADGTPKGIVARFTQQAYSNFISGNIFKDDNNDCIKDASESYLPNWWVKVEGDNAPLYIRTDTNGYYNIGTDLGSYNVSIVNPNHLWDANCPADTVVNITENAPNPIVNLGVRAVTDCPLLELDIGTPLVRRCFQSAYYVWYCNSGTTAAENAYVEVLLDPFFTYQNSTVTSVDLGDNLYSFDLGDVDIGECGNFRIDVYVDCDSTAIGQTHCVEAHIYPDSICGSSSLLWDGASIEVDAQCIGDSLEFTIKNVGMGDMSDSLEYLVVEDDLIWQRANFKLTSGDDIKFYKEANGLFYRLEAEQSPGHPGNSMPSVFVEGCGTNDDGEISLGFVNYYLLHEGDAFVSIDCQQSVGSFDPNDKQAFPIGYGDQHYITDSTDLEYLIRFQNTGTDTAFNIVIRDTINPHLNIETLRPGVASHDYRYDIDSSSIAVFHFENIMLPDSNINEPASHGFIKFNIEQKQNNPIGTHIMNDAAIYFDFNEPIITNTVFHTVGEDFMGVVTSITTPPEIAEAGISVNVFPNPFDEYTRFDIQGETVKELHLNLYDMTGQQVFQRQTTNQQHVTLYKNNLPTGVYVFRLIDEKQQLATGKLIVK